MLLLMAVVIAFPLTHHTVFLTPIGRNPGHLSRAINQQATRADIPLGSTYSEQSHLAVLTSVSHRLADAVLKEVHVGFHAAASTLEGPAALSIFSIVLQINCPSITSNMTGCGSEGDESSSISDDYLGGCLCGHFFIKTSQPVSKLLFSMLAPCPMEVCYSHCCQLQFEEGHKLFLPSITLQIFLLCPLVASVAFNLLILNRASFIQRLLLFSISPQL